MTAKERAARLARLTSQISTAFGKLAQLPEDLLESVDLGTDQEIAEGVQILSDLDKLLMGLRKKVPPRTPRQRPYHRRRKTASSRPS